MCRRDRLYRAYAVLAAVFLIASVAAAQMITPPPKEESDPLPVWASPLKGGPVRAAAVFPIDAQGDISALQARMDLKLAVHPFGGEHSPDEAIAKALDGKLDVLIVSAAKLADLSPTTRAALEAHLTRGAGLVWIGYAPDTTAELPGLLTPLGLNAIEPAPDFAARAGGEALTGLQPGYDVFSAFGGQTGRAVEWRFWSPRPHGHALLPLAPVDALQALETFENYLSLVCHALRWTAGRDPETAVASVEEILPEGPNALETPPQLPERFVQRMQQAAIPGALRQFRITLDHPAPRNYGVRVQLRYPGRDLSSAFPAAEELRKGAGQLTFSIPAGTGDCFVDVWLLDGVNVVDWFTQPVHLAAMPEIVKVSIGAAAVNANDRLRITATIEGRFQATQAQTAVGQMPISVFLRVTDAFGREVAQRMLPLPPKGGDVNVELPLIDLLAPYVRAEVFALFGTEPTLDWWIRIRADHRAADLLVRQPLPAGLALIVNEPGEGSFAGSQHRRALVHDGVAVISPRTSPAVGNIAADGMRLVADLGGVAQFPGDDFNPRAKSGIALRQAAAPYATMQPGLYVLSLDGGEQNEARRAAIEGAIRETDPRALVALLDDGYTAPESGGFRVLPAEASALLARAPDPAGYTAVRTTLATGERALERNRWLPWLAAVCGADALWISDDAPDPEAFAALTAETRRVQDGIDLLLHHAQPVPVGDDGLLEIDPDFAGVVRRFTFGKATVFALLTDPAGTGKGTAKLKVQGDARFHDLTALTDPRPTKNLSLKLHPGEAAIASLLPYEVTRVAIDVPESASAGRRLTLHASIKTRNALPGDHLLRMTITDLAGKPVEHYSRTILARDGAGSAWVPLAFNETPGRYRIRVRDVLTGVYAEANIVIIPADGNPVAAH